MEDLFDFDYQLEMYKPAATRRWGYWAMPVLDGDELVGKVDATADREAGCSSSTPSTRTATGRPRGAGGCDAEVDALGEWLGLEVVRA